ncbi:MAG TPA: phosphomannomutase/phosphoglucomutase [Myxococcota bacterium]|nr:phosphomannomutase/phosphoglucomutase [Myxococcota bacterium]
MKPAIFKAYDIRGLVPEELDARGALAIGRAFGRHVQGSPVVVGWDMRASAQDLRNAFVSGLRAEGRDVLEIGRVSTPMLYFATASSRAAAGAMITASHNPGRYNGFKLCAQNAVPIGIESGLAQVRDRALQLADEPTPATRGSVSSRDPKLEYYAMLLDLFPARPRLRAVVDAGNGIAGEALLGLFERLPLDLTQLYFEPDGSFPNHEADPLKAENLHDLQRAVREKGADLGIAFDGDGDRAVFVDETGEAVPADLMTALFCDVILERGLLGARPGVPILYDLRSSRIVPETLRARGAEPVRGRVGHAFMKAVMRERGACFGGELSGHYYFRFPAGYIADDGAAAMLLLLEALAARRRPLSELWRPYRKYRQSGEINRRVADVPATLARVRAQFADGAADELDGLTISYPDWWFNLRPSNTEPLLRLNLEAPDDASLARRRDQILALVES